MPIFIHVHTKNSFLKSKLNFKSEITELHKLSLSMTVQNGLITFVMVTTMVSKRCKLVNAYVVFDCRIKSGNLISGSILSGRIIVGTCKIRNA